PKPFPIQKQVTLSENPPLNTGPDKPSYYCFNDPILGSTDWCLDEMGSQAWRHVRIMLLPPLNTVPIKV
ncbi:hypothetical protein, partial [Salmonella sp. s55044]|uniref:hypothetical protein n=1 Tax=Salmonella sp. s55044 TaxID=3159677 RepID=UPI00397FEF74